MRDDGQHQLLLMNPSTSQVQQLRHWYKAAGNSVDLSPRWIDDGLQSSSNGNN